MGNLQLWVSVVNDGAFFGLIALSYYLTLVGAQFFNFAIGPYAMVAGMAASWLVISHSYSLWLAVALALLSCMALGALTEVLVVRPVQRRSLAGELPALVAVAAVLFAIQQGAGIVFGLQGLPGQAVLPTGLFHLGSATVEPSTGTLVIATVLTTAAVAAWVRFTRTGRMLRAVGDSNSAARLLGFPVGRIRLVAFVVGGLVAGIAGLFFAATNGSGVNFQIGLTWTLDGFLALVIGGTGSIIAPLVGGFLLAMAQVFVPYYFGGRTVSYFLLGIAVVFFAFRPQGIFAQRVRT